VHAFRNQSRYGMSGTTSLALIGQKLTTTTLPPLLAVGIVMTLVGFAFIIAGWSPVLAALAALSILLGNFVALAQTNIRRLLAYSAVAHGGYTLLGII